MKDDEDNQIRNQNNNVCSPPFFIQAAENAAKSKVTYWIRATLREVALQVLQKHVEVPCAANDDEEEEEDEDDAEEIEGIEQQQLSSFNKNNKNAAMIVQLPLIEDAVMEAQEVCQVVADKWCDKLRMLGHDGIASWIQDIVTAEKDLLFYIDPYRTSSSPSSSASQGDNVDEVQHPTAKATTAATTTCIGEILNNDKDKHKQENSKTTTSKSITIMGGVNKIGVHDVLGATDNYVSPADIIQKLNELGSTSQQLYCYDWNFIEQLTQQIPSRLHNNYNINSNRNHDDDDDKVSSFTPKKKSTDLGSVQVEGLTTTTNSSQQLPNLTTAQRQWIIDRKRKRKKRGGERREKNKQMEDDYYNTAAKHQQVVRYDGSQQPRLPCTYGEIQFKMDDIHTELSTDDKRTLDTYVHTGNNNDDDAPSPLMLGSLRDLGRFRYYYDNVQLDHEETNQQTEKQIRRKQRAAIKQRLGDRIPATGAIELTSASSSSMSQQQQRKHQQLSSSSRIVPTIEQQQHKQIMAFAKNYNDKTTNNCKIPIKGTTKNGRHWLDFDLGHCMLELSVPPPTDDGANEAPTAMTTRKKSLLCSFPNMEVMLLDEDEGSDDDNNSSNT